MRASELHWFPGRVDEAPGVVGVHVKRTVCWGDRPRLRHGRSSREQVATEV